jgi:hypothetical protein
MPGGGSDLTIFFDDRNNGTLSMKGASLDAMLAKFLLKEFVQCIFWYDDGVAYHMDNVCGDDNGESVGMKFTSYANDSLKDISIYLDGTGVLEVGEAEYTFTWTYDSTTKEYTCVLSGGEEI